MKNTILLLLFLLSVFTGFGQLLQKISITPEKTGDGVYDFYAENPNNMPMQLMLYFTELDNMSADVELPYCTTITKGTQKLFTLKRDNIDIPGGFNYKYQTRVGAYPVFPDVDFSYQLPSEPGDTVKAKAYNYSHSATPQKVVWGIELQNSDTVRASRDGVVVLKTETRMRDSLKVGMNTLTILHNDLTMGKYEGFADDLLLVDIGETVNTGDPVGVAEQSVKQKPLIRFSVYYTNTRIDSIVNERLRDYYTYLNPYFEVGRDKIQLEDAVSYVK